MTRARLVRWLGRGALVAGALAVLAALALALLLRTDPGRALLARTIADMASVPGEFAVAIGRLDGRLPGEIVLADVAVSDRDGVWLVVDSARLDWRPWALTGRRLVVDRLAVDGVRIARAPAGGTDEATPLPREIALPALPVDIRLGAFDIDHVALGADLLGEAIALRATGRFGAEAAGDARGHVRIERTDGLALTASLDAVLEAATATLDIDLAVAEPAGGLVARLAGLPDLPAVSLSLKGRGPAADWRGRLAAEAAGLASLDADVTIGLGGERTLGLAGSADIARLVDADVLALTGPAPRFDIDLALGAQTLTVRQARFTGAAFEAAAHGTLDPETLAADLDATARLLDPAIAGRFVEGLALESGEIAAKLTGPPDRLAFDATIQAGGLAAEGVAVGRLESHVAGVLRPHRVDGKVDATLTGIAADPGQPELAALPPRLDASSDVAVDLTAQTIALSDIRATGRDIDVTGSGTLDLERGTVAVRAQAAIARLAPFAALAGIDLDGRADAVLTVDSADRGGTASGSLALRLESLASADLPLVPTLGDAAHLTATIGALSADGVDIPEFALTGANLAATGKLAVTDEWSTIVLDATLRDHDLAAWSDTAGVALAGRAGATLHAGGALDDPDLRADVDLDAATVEGTGPLNGRVAIKAGTLASKPAGDVSASLTGPGGPVEAQTRFALGEADRLALDGIRVNALGARATGGLALDLASGRAAGGIDIAADDLARVGALAGTPLRGRAEARLTLADDQAKQTGTLTLSSPLVALPRPDGSDIAVSGIAVSAALLGLTPQPSGRATVTIARVTAADLILDDLSLAASGAADRLSFDIRGGGELAAPFDLAAGGSAAQDGTGWTVTLDRLDGSAAGQAVALRRPATATLTPDELSLSATEIAVGQGSVQARASLDPQRVSARLDFADLPLALAALVTRAAGLDGTLTATATLDGDPASPVGAIDLRLSDVTTQDVDLARSVALQGEATARLQAGRLTLDADVGGFSEKALALDAEVPMRLSVRPFAVSVPPDGAVRGTLDWRGEIGALWEMLPLDDHRLSGRADVSASAAGTVADPTVTGRLALTGGRYENLAVGTVIDKLDVAAHVDAGRTLTIDVSGTDGGTGTVSGKGEMAIDPVAAFPTSVDLSFADATLVRRDEVTLAAGGNLALRGDLTATSLAGRIETTRVEARLDASLPPSVVDLEVVDASASNGGGDNAEQPDGAAILTLDLDVVVPGQAFVRGRGLDSEWRGELHVTGSAAEPAVEGTLSFVRGQFTFSGKRFSLNESTIYFDGSTTIDPLLNIRAAHQASDVTALILITGRASNPAIELTSTPSLPQDEVLSRVLFGKGAGALSPVEGLQLAAAIAQLSGKGPAGAGILDRVRESLGVDVLEVGASGDGTSAATLRAGRYLNDRTFVGVTQGTQAGSTGVTVEIEVLPNIVVDTTLDQSGANKSGIKWKWDY